jgi:hypothetical protein
MKRGREGMQRPADDRARRRARMRSMAAPCVVAVVAAFMVSDGHGSMAILASSPVAPLPPAQQAAPATLAPTPSTPAAPSTPAVHGPASDSKPSGLPGLGQQTVPETALAAYQRAAVTIDAADSSCSLDWTLLAGIGTVESDNGQFGGSHLTNRGIARPAIIGPRLDGRDGTSLVRDTDAGRLDGDTTYDRAVGPMQFLPSTWAAVAVDGDGDGKRNVQDINDAALGSAVYLCSGGADLSTKSGMKAALLRYNHSQAYVTRVMAIASGLQSTSTLGSFSQQSLDTQMVGDGTQTTRDAARNTTHHSRHHHQSSDNGHHQHKPGHHAGHQPSHQPSNGPTGLPSSGPTSSPTGGPSVGPSGGPTTGPPSGPSDGPSGSPTGGPTGGPTPPADDPVIPTPVPEALVSLTAAEVQAIDKGWAACVQTLPTGWGYSDMQSCLADQLGVQTDDLDLKTFLDWAVAQSLVPPARDPESTPSS